jgi:D-beta-D-heptose 7-phosphate kinase/D-beta-D-heptose 1-phosphate adenosyltransferase
MNTQQQKQFKILLIGDNCKDIYQYGTVDRISPEAPVPVFVLSHKEERDGMAGNVFNNLEALGCYVNYLHGETSTKTRILDSRSRQQIVRIDNDIASDPISIESELPNYDAIVISDYNKGTVSYELIESLRKEYTGPIFVDTKKTDLSRLEGCIIKINSYEFARLTTKPSNGTQLIVTHGDKGVTCGQNFAAAHKVEVADVCGAGDTFLAALAFRYLDNSGDLWEAVKFANKASSITVQHLGVYAPSLEEIVL